MMQKNKNAKNRPIIIANTKAYITSLKSFYNLQDKIWSKLAKDTYRYYCIVPDALINIISREEYHALIVGAQNFEALGFGSHTGATTLENLIEAGARLVMLGHSEVRKELGDNDETINEKLKKTLGKNIVSVLCVGENKRNEESDYAETIKTQLKKDLYGIDKTNISKLIIAYEPVWAIGAAQAANSAEAQEAIIIIRRTLVDLFGIDAAKKVKVVYGGAVDEYNAKRFVDEATADGVLVGRACMDADKFSGIVNSLLE